MRNRIPRRYLTAVTRILAGLAASVTLMALVSACAAPQALTIRDAQDAYSTGAELELRERFDPGNARAAGPVDDPQQYYQLAFGLASQALRENEASLVQDQLWGTAVAIRAFSAWRLGDIALALDECGRVVAGSEAAAAGIWPRDAAMCELLRSLVDIDNLAKSAAAFGVAAPQDPAVAHFLEHAVGTLAEIDRVDSRRPNHPFTIYLAAARSELAYVVKSGINNLGNPQRRRVAADQVYQRIRRAALDRWQALSAAPEFDRERKRILVYAAFYDRQLE